LFTSRYYRNKELARREGLHSFLPVPVRVRDKIIGAFHCYMGSIHEFSPKEIELFSLWRIRLRGVGECNLAMNSLLVREMHSSDQE